MNFVTYVFNKVMAVTVDGYNSFETPINSLDLLGDMSFCLGLDSAYKQDRPTVSLLPEVDLLTYDGQSLSFPNEGNSNSEMPPLKRLREDDSPETSPSNGRDVQRSRSVSLDAPSEAISIEQKVEQLLQDVENLKKENNVLKREVSKLKLAVKKLNSSTKGNKRSSGRGPKKK